MQTMESLEVGQMAPDFALKGPGGQVITLSEYRGKKNVVLAFFPLAFSPVCSHQLPLLQRDLPLFRQAQAEVLGISVDSHYANEAFARQLGLGFPLLSDFRRETSIAYGVFDPVRLRSGRAIFVIDRQGRVAYKDRNPDEDVIPAHEPVLAALSRLA